MQLSWFDQRLAWNETKHGDFFEIPGSEIWTPTSGFMQKITSATSFNLKDLGSGFQGSFAQSR